jgi:hypothetical protein
MTSPPRLYIACGTGKDCVGRVAGTVGANMFFNACAFWSGVVMPPMPPTVGATGEAV